MLGKLKLQILFECWQQNIINKGKEQQWTYSINITLNYTKF